jgi:hypothetical protein
MTTISWSNNLVQMEEPWTLTCIVGKCWAATAPKMADPRRTDSISWGRINGRPGRTQNNLLSEWTSYFQHANIYSYILKFVICGTRHCAGGEVVVGMAEVYSFCNIQDGIHPPSDDTDSLLCLFVIVAQGLPLFYWLPVATGIFFLNLLDLFNVCICIHLYCMSCIILCT